MFIKNEVALILLIILTAAIFLPLTLLISLALVNSINPMQVVFITSFTVENETNETVFITPLGAVDQEGNRAILPQYLRPFPGIPVLKEGNFKIKPGGRKTIYYDWDDINFSEILIKTENLERVLVVDAKPTTNQFHPPESSHFVIENLKDLQTPTPELRAAARFEDWEIWVLPLIYSLSVYVFIYSTVQYVRLKKKNK